MTQFNDKRLVARLLHLKKAADADLGLLDWKHSVYNRKEHWQNSQYTEGQEVEKQAFSQNDLFFETAHLFELIIGKVQLCIVASWGDGVRKFPLKVANLSGWFSPGRIPAHARFLKVRLHAKLLLRWSTQFDLLYLKVTQVVVVDFADAIDADSCRQHEAKLSKDSAHDAQVALPVKDVSYVDLRENKRVHNRVGSQKDETNSYSEGWSRQKRDFVPLPVKVASCSPVHESNDADHDPSLPVKSVHVGFVVLLQLWALRR